MYPGRLRLWSSKKPFHLLPINMSRKLATSRHLERLCLEYELLRQTEKNSFRKVEEGQGKERKQKEKHKTKYTKYKHN